MFSDKKLDVLAYENAPSTYRKPFDETTEEISVKVKDGIVEIVQVQLTGNAAHLREAVKTITEETFNVLWTVPAPLLTVILARKSWS